jgi:rhamnose transport system permease protein
MQILKRLKLSTMDMTRSRDIGLLGFIILLSVLVQSRNDRFLTLENINDLVTNTAILSIMAVGMMMVIITRGIDLSIGSTLALAGMTTALAVGANPDMPPLVALFLGGGVGLACGMTVGALIAIGGILPIIATLGMMSVYRGLTFMISGGKWVSAHQMPDSFKAIATGRIAGVNILIVIAVISYIVFYYFLNHTRTGRQIYATGSNPESARISGINSDKIIWLVYSLMGLLSGLSGVLWVSKFASAQGDTAAGYELSVIAACVLGGVNIAGGSGRISGLLMGTLLLGILNNALPLINVSPFWQNMIQGLVILFAVIVNSLIRRKAEQRALRRRII